MGTAILMTAVAVAIGGLAIELLLFAISRSLQTQVTSSAEQAGTRAVIHLKPSESSTGAIEWAEEVAA
jgi:hypothetical protein